MANEVFTAVDPFGKTIFLLHGIGLDGNEEHEIFDNAATVIQKPAILIEAKENDTAELYYFRSIGWHNTMLIKVKFNNNRWEAYNCTKNPSSEELSALLKKGKQLI
jgi:hypothetical protein